MNGKDVLLFLSGLVVGGGIGYAVASKILDKKYFDKYDARARELEDYYENTMAYTGEDLEEEPEKEEPAKREDGALSRSQRNEIREKLLRNARQTTNYAAYFDSKVDPAEKEHPEDDEEESEEMDSETYAQDEEDFEEHQRSKTRPPRIISADAAGELEAGWEEQTLLYYYYDGTLTTEDDVIVDDVAGLLGDCLDKYGFAGNEDEMVIYVQNFVHQAVYEVQKVMARYDG